MSTYKYAKKDHIILSQVSNSRMVEQKYKIIRLTQDTLILVPVGEDIFALSESNEQNQYVFVNSMHTYKFEELYYETVFFNFNNPISRLKIILYIDSAKRSRIVIKSDSSGESEGYKTPISKKEYKSLIEILSSCDLNCFQEENTVIDKKYPYEILEIRYNEQAKKCRRKLQIFKRFILLSTPFKSRVFVKLYKS